MGVAEWRLKINQPSLFQFVRKQKRKEIIKRERVGREKKKRNRGELNHHNPKCRVKLEKQRGERAQKEKEILQSFDCFFKTSSTAMPAPHHPQQRCWGLGHPLGGGGLTTSAETLRGRGGKGEERKGALLIFTLYEIE